MINKETKDKKNNMAINKKTLVASVSLVVTISLVVVR